MFVIANIWSYILKLLFFWQSSDPNDRSARNVRMDYSPPPSAPLLSDPLHSHPPNPLYTHESDHDRSKGSEGNRPAEGRRAKLLRSEVAKEPKETSSKDELPLDETIKGLNTKIGALNQQIETALRGRKENSPATGNSFIPFNVLIVSYSSCQTSEVLNANNNDFERCETAICISFPHTLFQKWILSKPPLKRNQ